MRQGVLSGSIAIADNQVSPTLLFSFVDTYTAAILEYSIIRNGVYRTGNLFIANDGSITSSNGTYVETGVSGVTLSTDISAGNVRVLYTSTNTGFAGTFKYSMRKWN